MNTRFPLRDIHGRCLFAVGGQQSYRTFQRGPYMVSLEWVENEPAMVVSANKFGFVICLSSAGKYANPDGSPCMDGGIELYNALPEFRRDQNAAEHYKLVSTVMAYIPDLLHMPPQPPSVKADAKGDALLEVRELDDNGHMLREARL